MISKIALYKVKPEEVDTVLDAIRSFVAAIARNEPQTRYEALQHADQVSFTHTMHFTDEAAEQKHGSSDYTKAFTDVLYPRCESGPDFLDVTLIGPEEPGQ